MAGLRTNMALATILAATGLLAPSAVARGPARPVAPSASAGAEDARLRALEDAISNHELETSFEARMRARLPVDRFADFSLGPVLDDGTKRRQWAATLAAIDPARLGESDRTDYRILETQLADDGLGEAKYWLSFDIYRAPGIFSRAQQVLGAHALATPEDARHYVLLVTAYGAMLDSLDAKTEAQMARGLYLPRPALPVARSLWDGVAKASANLRPSDARIAGLPPEVRTALIRSVDDVIATRLNPAFAKLLATIGDGYAEKAPEAVGIGQYPQGKDVYRALILTHTTVPLTPEDIHRRGLIAVADVGRRMKAIRDQLGFKGSAAEFYTKISADPRFIARTPADVEANFWKYLHAIEPKLPAYFRTVPAIPFAVQRLSPLVEAGQTFGFYSPPTSDPRGIYYYNGSALEKRSQINAATLIYHELIPGHHLQYTVQMASPGLSPFRQRYFPSVFAEGWGEYAASLGVEMKLYDTPETLYGRYINEMLVAERLVVDSGMNYFGWPLEKARAYMHDLGTMSDVEIATETLRYSVNMPGQALAYRIGYEKMWEVRRRAEKELGKRFDIREFHDVVIGKGARPLSVLDDDVNAYIAARKSRN